MKTPHHSLLLFIPMMFLLVACSEQVKEVGLPQESAVTTPPSTTESAQSQLITSRAAQETKERVANLAKMEDYKQQRKDALETSPAVRREIFQSKSEEWNHILEKHDSEYQQLKKLAEHAEHQMIDCTICGGDTYLDYCIFCQEDSNGRCSECEGTGGLVIGQVCSACLGTGECFMCSGTKMMMCLFCDDGSVDLALPPHYQTINFD